MAAPNLRSGLSGFVIALNARPDSVPFRRTAVVIFGREVVPRYFSPERRVFDTILGFKGVDYNIFLASRAWRRPVMLIEVGFLVAFGVLLDALLVRSVLVPALTLLIGRRMWWPSRLSRPVELPDGQRPLADDEEPALQR